MRVIDSSALVKYFSREDGWERVREIILDGVTTIDLTIKEVANALWKKISKNEIKREVAEKILASLVNDEPFPIKRQDRYLLEAFELATEWNITIYDALFIEMAREESLELVTSDAKQAEVAKRLGLNVILV